MNKTVKILAGAATIGAVLAVSSAALAAQPIEGNWKTQGGDNATISKCGGAFCIKLTSGKYSGKRIGKVTGSGKSYSGTVTDPAENKTYSGSARVSGSSMRLKGCVAKIFCKTQTWKKR